MTSDGPLFDTSPTKWLLSASIARPRGENGTGSLRENVDKRSKEC